VQPARFRWNPPDGHVSRREGVDELIFWLDGIEWSGHLRPRYSSWGGPELAAEYSAADRTALYAQLKDEVAAEKERRAKHEATWAEILDLPQFCQRRVRRARTSRCPPCRQAD
jgi:hypothetical protein